MEYNTDNTDASTLLALKWCADDRNTFDNLKPHLFDKLDPALVQDRIFREYPSNIYKEILEYLEELKYDTQWNEVVYVDHDHMPQQSSQAFEDIIIHEYEAQEDEKDVDEKDVDADKEHTSEFYEFMPTHVLRYAYY